MRWERGNERTRHHDLRRTNYDSGSHRDPCRGPGLVPGPDCDPVVEVGTRHYVVLCNRSKDRKV